MSTPQKTEATINVTGRVQGVGFRPFIYRKAVKNGLVGYVINLGDAGVEIVVEGTEENIHRFIREISRDAPEVSEIEGVSYTFSPFRGRFKEFIIDKSQNRGKVASGIFPPDIGICPQCLEDMETPGGRWYDYPFTACAWCGPRFTGIRSLPYDRERTHMHEFPMCSSCQRDYYDPMDRRFDAQGTTCKHCGPSMSLYTGDGTPMEGDNLFKTVADLLLEGNIVAVKGIGGIHLASLATDDAVVEEFRARKTRPYQPFALMSPNLKAVESFAFVDEAEERVMTSWRRPIVLLKKRGEVISELVTPGLDRVGVMLPYTGIQTMIFKRLPEPALIMTSGNMPGLPMSISNKAAFKELRGLADYYLLHDRQIVNRADDSVLRMIDGHPAFTRRSRGYVPEPIDIPLKTGTAVALGAELRNAAVVTTEGKAFTTQFLGDITSLEGLEFEKQAVKTLRDLLNITRNPDVIGCDLHPQYMTSRLGEVMSRETGVTLVKSQHHHAHIISVAAENGVSEDEEVIGIALDGAGYGPDGSIWGGEVLRSTYNGYERAGNLEELPMPGGDLCAIYPYRMLIAALSRSVTGDIIRDITKNHVTAALPHGETELEVVLKQSQSPSIHTSSAGRFLDSVSAMLGLTYRRTYEGEPAMRLESLATQGDPDSRPLKPVISVKNGRYVLETSNILKTLFYLQNSVKKQDIAAISQKYLASGVAEIAVKVSEDTGISKVGLSGGVFVNGYITRTVRKYLESEGLHVMLHRHLPPGDGGTALGQSLHALRHVM